MLAALFILLAFVIMVIMTIIIVVCYVLDFIISSPIKGIEALCNKLRKKNKKKKEEEIVYKY